MGLIIDNTTSFIENNNSNITSRNFSTFNTSYINLNRLRSVIINISSIDINSRSSLTNREISNSAWWIEVIVTIISHVNSIVTAE